VLDSGEGFCVKHIAVSPGQRLSLQYHRHRAENWEIISGKGEVQIDDEKITVQGGDHVHIPLGARHRVSNASDEILRILELQSGDVLDEDDIIRLEDDYARS
jgi:mannose-1-phosphate guanylyltransferase